MSFRLYSSAWRRVRQAVYSGGVVWRGSVGYLRLRPRESGAPIWRAQVHALLVGTSDTLYSRRAFQGMSQSLPGLHRPLRRTNHPALHRIGIALLSFEVGMNERRVHTLATSHQSSTYSPGNPLRPSPHAEASTTRHREGKER